MSSISGNRKIKDHGKAFEKAWNHSFHHKSSKFINSEQLFILNYKDIKFNVELIVPLEEAFNWF